MTDERYRIYLADNLNELLYQSGKTQAQTAKELKISVKTYRNYLNGISGAPADMLLRIAEYYGVTIEKLLRGKNEKRGSNKTKEENEAESMFSYLDSENRKFVLAIMKNLLESQNKKGEA